MSQYDEVPETDSQWIRRIAEEGTESQASGDSFFNSQPVQRKRVWPAGKLAKIREEAEEQKKRDKENLSQDLSDDDSQQQEGADTEDDEVMEEGDEEEEEGEKDKEMEGDQEMEEEEDKDGDEEMEDREEVELPDAQPADASTAAAVAGALVESAVRKELPGDKPADAVVKEAAAIREKSPAPPAAAALGDEPDDPVQSPITRSMAAAKAAAAAARKKEVEEVMENVELTGGEEEQHGEDNASETSSVQSSVVPSSVASGEEEQSPSDDVIDEEPVKKKKKTKKEKDVPFTASTRHRLEMTERLEAVMDMGIEGPAMVRANFLLLLDLTTLETPKAEWKALVKKYAKDEADEIAGDQFVEAEYPRKEMSDEEKDAAHRKLARMVVTRQMKHQMRALRS